MLSSHMFIRRGKKKKKENHPANPFLFFFFKEYLPTPGTSLLALLVAAAQQRGEKIVFESVPHLLSPYPPCPRPWMKIGAQSRERTIYQLARYDAVNSGRDRGFLIVFLIIFSTASQSRVSIPSICVSKYFWMSMSIFHSSWLDTNEIDTPTRPKRPVRPIRWRYVCGSARRG